MSNEEIKSEEVKTEVTTVNNNLVVENKKKDDKIFDIEETVTKLREELEDLKAKNDRFKKIVEEMVKKISVKENIRNDLAEAIKSGSEAYAKIENPTLRTAAAGLVHASILKLHEEINKI